MDQFRYFAALQAAQAVLDRLDTTPAMSAHERLANATYLILGAIGHVEERLTLGCPLCPIFKEMEKGEHSQA